MDTTLKEIVKKAKEEKSRLNIVRVFRDEVVRNGE